MQQTYDLEDKKVLDERVRISQVEAEKYANNINTKPTAVESRTILIVLLRNKYINKMLMDNIIMNILVIIILPLSIKYKNKKISKVNPNNKPNIGDAMSRFLEKKITMNQINNQ